MLWSDEVGLQIQGSAKHYILAEVKLNDGQQPWGLVGIYGDPARVLYWAIWDEIETFINRCEGHVVILGDFNAIKAQQEKWGGSSQLGPNNRGFNSWINRLGLVDLGHNGPCYTWSNGQGGSSFIAQRLDRGLATVSWMLQYPSAAIFHLPRFGSDHLPILLRTEPRPIRGKRKFRYENW